MLGLKPGDGGMTIEQCEQLKRENHDVFSIDGELGRLSSMGEPPPY